MLNSSKERGMQEMDDWMRMKECMTDAGCSKVAIERAEQLFASGASEELIRCLRSCRGDTLEEIHTKQRQLDRLDKLIRKAQYNL